jgi:hypothetical protein
LIYQRYQVVKCCGNETGRSGIFSLPIGKVCMINGNILVSEEK